MERNMSPPCGVFCPDIDSVVCGTRWDFGFRFAFLRGKVYFQQFLIGFFFFTLDSEFFEFLSCIADIW